MISRILETEYPVPKDIAFRHIVFFENCSTWMDEHDWCGMLFLVSEGKIAGMEIANPDKRIAPIVMPIIELVTSERVIYGSAKATEDNVSVAARAFFPFKEMQQSIHFKPTEAGCKVFHEIKLKPKGLIGIFTCRFIVMPQLLSDLKTKNEKFKEYLTTCLTKSPC